VTASNCLAGMGLDPLVPRLHTSASNLLPFSHNGFCLGLMQALRQGVFLP